MSFGNGNVKTAIDLTSSGAACLFPPLPSLPSPPLPSSFLLRIGAAVERHKSDIYTEREREGERHQTVLEGKAAKLEKEDGDDDDDDDDGRPLAHRGAGGRRVSQSGPPRLRCRPTPNLTYSSVLAREPPAASARVNRQRYSSF